MRVRLDSIIKKASKRLCGCNSYPVLSITKENGLVLQRDRFKKQIASVDQSKYLIVERGQLVLSIHLDEGVLGIQRIVDEGIVSPAYKIWDVNTDIVRLQYLELLLKAPKNVEYYKSKAQSSVAGRCNISDKELLALEVEIPPLETQDTALYLIEKVNDIINCRQQELIALDDLIKARFVEMFGDESNPFQWPVISVEDVANVTVGVVIKPAQYYTDAEHGVKAFRSLNIGPMLIKDGDWVYFSYEGNDKNAKSQLKENDLLIVRSGAPGTACVVPKQYEGCNAIDIIIARPNTEKVNPYYLCSYTNMPHGKRQIEEGTGGAAQQHFNVGKYNKLQLLLPPLELQNAFVDFIAQVEKSKVVAQKALNEMQLLFDSLMQQYFG